MNQIIVCETWSVTRHDICYVNTDSTTGTKNPPFDLYTRPLTVYSVSYILRPSHIWCPKPRVYILNLCTDGLHQSLLMVVLHASLTYPKVWYLYPYRHLLYIWICYVLVDFSLTVLELFLLMVWREGQGYLLYHKLSDSLGASCQGSFTTIISTNTT